MIASKTARQMGRKRRRKSRPRGERFMLLNFWEIESPAFLALSPEAVRVYIDIRKAMNFDASNNDQVAYSHRQAEKVLHSAWRRAANALAELVHFGFLKCRQNGEPGPNIRPASEWQLLAFACGGQPASKDFMRWQGEPFVPPYRSSVATKPEKRVPTGNTQAPRLQHAGAAPDSSTTKRPKRRQSAGNMQALRVPRRRQHAGTSNVTRQEGPSPSTPAPVVPVRKPRAFDGRAAGTSAAAPAAAAPAAGKREQQRQLRKSAVPRPPVGTEAAKARWLRDLIASGRLTRTAAAAAIDVDPPHVDELLAGRCKISSTAWRKLAAQAAEEPA